MVGFASGAIPAVAANLVLLKGASLLGVNFGGFALRFPEQATAIYRLLGTMLAEDTALWPPRSSACRCATEPGRSNGWKRARLPGKSC